MAERAKGGSVLWGILPIAAVAVVWRLGYDSTAPLYVSLALGLAMAAVAVAATRRAALVAVVGVVAVGLTMLGATALLPRDDGARLRLLPPVGSVMAFAGSPESLPAEWLPCDGRELDVAEYPALHAAIASAHGGEGAKFRLPDYRGLFLRGVDGEAGRDPDRESRTAPGAGGNPGNRVGSLQEDALAAHDHEYKSFVLKDNDWTRGVRHPLNGTGDTANRASQKRGGAESRPKNAYVEWIIRVR